jgi:uncharacterized protein (DUF302 family)
MHYFKKFASSFDEAIARVTEELKKKGLASLPK